MSTTVTLTHEDLDSAIQNKQLFLVFQPTVALGRLMAIGAEALLRWQHPSYGLLQPGLFLPFVAEQGRSQEIARYVAREAVRACADWRKAGLDWRVAINLSVEDLADGTFASVLALMLDQAELPAEAISVDISETEFAERSATLLPALAQLRSLGCGVALDSLPGDRQLQSIDALPLSELKLAGEGMLRFVHRTQHAESGRMVARLERARSQGLRRTAVGVESEATLWAVQRSGFDTVQGTYICRPLPAHDLVRWDKIWRQAAENLSEQKARALSEEPPAPVAAVATPPGAPTAPLEAIFEDVTSAPPVIVDEEPSPPVVALESPPYVAEAMATDNETPDETAILTLVEEETPAPAPSSAAADEPPPLAAPMPKILSERPAPPPSPVRSKEKPATGASEDELLLRARTLRGIDKPIQMTVANPGRDRFGLFKKRGGKPQAR